MKVKLNGLFDITKKEEELSREIYGGKIIKCLVAPFHTYNDMKDFDRDGSIVFPERNLTIPERVTFVTDQIAKDEDEIRVVTTDTYILQDMISPCVRTLSKAMQIGKCPIKTFQANPIEIREELLNRLKGSPSSESTRVIQDAIKRMKNEKPFSDEERAKIKARLELVGDSFLSSVLMDLFVKHK